MIKTIQYHLAENKADQEHIENQQSERLTHIWQTNKAVFASMMPNLLAAFDDNVVDEFGLFCNKLGHFNLASKGSGQVIYDLNPKAESEQDIADFQRQAPVFHLSGNRTKAQPLLRSFQMPESGGYVPALPMKPLPAKPHTVILFGLGLGHGLEALLKVCSPENIVVYEPNLDFFRASVRVANWQAILLGAQDRGTRMFLQIGQDASGIGSDLKELHQAFQCDEVFVLRHYHHPVMDAVYDYVLSPDFSLQQLLEGNVEVKPQLAVNQYLPPRAGRVQSNAGREQAKTVIDAAKELKAKNLAAFAEQFPDIYQQFKDYKPRQWQAFVDASGELNLYHELRLGALYHAQPSQLAAQSVQLFSEEPNRNDMFAGYTGGKLWSYVHFQHARQFGALFDELESDGQFIPDVLSSVIWFGMGLGYQLEQLVNHYDVKSLYIYEPNPDFFYWSLFTVPWHEILPQQREKGMHWYINIGDDGTYLSEDMFSQFHSEGGYLTASAYFYIPMHYPAMQQNIQQLKRDFQSYLMLCEYYDHVRFYLAHSLENFSKGALALRKNAVVPEALRETPVMIVGNGPSLDATIELLKEREHEFIIVSCGTTLKALYEAGITPDFHTDVEQNRATYHWVTQVPDRAWLKQVRALTLTSFHPDTAALFNEHWVVFKKGESGTSCFLRSKEVAKQFATLDYCYPTVSNMALSIMLKMGFTNIYLTGVDLGFKDFEHHHSKRSAYYKSPTEKSWSNYRKSAGDGIPVRGNLQPWVLTKYEFHLSSRVMSQLLRIEEQAQVKNTSDGAFIQGTTPCRFEDIPTAAPLQREAVLADIRAALFTREHIEPMVERVQALNNAERIREEAERFLQLLQTPVHSRNEAMERLAQEKALLTELFVSGQSLWFYLIYTSAHFVSSALVRLLYIADNEETSLENFRRGTEIWQSYIETARDQWIEQGTSFDQIMVKALQSTAASPPTTP
ncbi:6-hydroxymethylpterin diphosphokinase MptE-like protein [Aliidiomarina celeris]|uniref:6-hydroxymethylpterin diphosphokinase MptE-like protein n=1 Tax=Aliidiomarina celeris TaxID=2249428 RepID=UPI000DEB47A1|nr:6-hydroxymethylpterin diphosphokinase MptE-like protein [Aliidiomarina celeris]